MKAASISEIKGILKTLNTTALTEIVLRLARAKKDNKELLTYLLFEAEDTGAYTESVKKEMDEAFKNIYTGNIYFAKKGLRKVLRNTNKYIRYTGSKVTEADLIMYYCFKLKELHIIHKSPSLVNLYEGQIKKLESIISSFHEDLQYDYKKSLESLYE